VVITDQGEPRLIWVSPKRRVILAERINSHFVSQAYYVNCKALKGVLCEISCSLAVRNTIHGKKPDHSELTNADNENQALL
jgi:hypothetical protein